MSRAIGGREQCDQGLKEASDTADRRSGSREFHTEVAAVEKTCDAKYEATAGFANRRTDDDRSCLTG